MKALERVHADLFREKPVATDAAPVVCIGPRPWGVTGLAPGELEPQRSVTITGGGASCWRRGEGARSVEALDDSPLGHVRRLLTLTPATPGAWVGVLSYELGSHVEPATGRVPQETVLAELVRVEAGAPGVAACEPAPPSSAIIELRSDAGRAGYEARVERALEYIRAGDVYQANIAHRLRGPFVGSGRDLFERLAASARPLHGAYVQQASAGGRARAVLSLSPELFLRFDASTRRLETRPMKGTRPGSGDPIELRDAPKDRAELAMIVDLMRNDLGRVCEFGSVRVDVPRAIERHASGQGAVLQATSTVSGVVRDGLDAADILGATFPPGSVTGAPKVRAMQVIDELEGFGRGPYCGCVGVFSDDGSFELSVLIRTAIIEGRVDARTGHFVDAELSYPVGAGIVADSDPTGEWLETLAKAGVLSPACVVRDR